MARVGDAFESICTPFPSIRPNQPHPVMVVQRFDEVARGKVPDRDNAVVARNGDHVSCGADRNAVDLVLRLPIPIMMRGRQKSKRKAAHNSQVRGSRSSAHAPSG